MKSKRSLPCLQQPTVHTYPAVDTSSSWPPMLCKIHFNIIFPSTPNSSRWSLSSKFAFLLFTMCAWCPTHLIFDVITLQSKSWRLLHNFSRILLVPFLYVLASLKPRFYNPQLQIMHASSPFSFDEISYPHCTITTAGQVLLRSTWPYTGSQKNAPCA